jgi:hypothetical protein
VGFNSFLGKLWDLKTVTEGHTIHVHKNFFAF